MRKTRKLGIQKQVRKKQKSKRRGRGINEVPFLLKSMLSNVHKYGQEFTEPALVSYILQDLPRASVTEAIENAPYKKEVTDLISQRLHQSAKSNNYVIASKIINSIPANYLTIARQKQELIHKKTIAEEALDTYINYAKPVHDRMKEVSTKLSNLYKEKEELEKTIGHSKLGKEFNKLKTQHKELVSNKSVLNKSQASLVRLRLNAIYYSGLRKEFNKLNTIKKEIEKQDKICSALHVDDLEAYRREHELINIVGNLQYELEDLRTQERLLNQGQGKRRRTN